MTVDDDSTLTATSEPPPPKRARRAAFAFLGAALVVLIGVGAVGAFAFLRASSFGDRGASASAMPPDTQIYVDVDFGSLGDLDRLLRAFGAAFDEAGLQPGLDPVIDRLDEELRMEFGIGVDDVTPWVGRDLGLGITSLNADAFGANPDVLLAVSVRDGAGADDFVSRMIGVISERDGVTFTSSEYQGVTVFASDDEIEGEPLAVARSDDMLLVGTDVSVVRRGIDAQAGPSLADDAVMDELFGALPDERAISVYVSPNIFDELLDGFGPVLVPVPDIPDTDLGAFALGMSLVAEGVQVDFVQELPDPADGSLGAQAADAAGSAELPGMLPGETFFYLGVAGGDDQLAVGLDEVMAQLEPGLGADLAELEAALGFRLEEDLLRYLGGDFGVGVFPSDSPIFGIPGAPPIGGIATLGVTDAAAVAETIDKVAAFISGEGAPLETRTAGDSRLYAFPGEGGDVVVFGVAGPRLVLATDAGTVADLSGDGPKLADDAFFGEAAAALPTSGDPFLFVDLRAALRALDAPPEFTDVVAPIRGMVAGGDSDGSISRVTLLTLIDY